MSSVKKSGEGVVQITLDGKRCEWQPDFHKRESWDVDL